MGFQFKIIIILMAAFLFGCGQSSGDQSSSGSNFTTVGDALRSSAGGDSSGGGNMVRSPVTGKFVLLDFMVAAPDKYLNFVGEPGVPLDVTIPANSDPTMTYPYPYTYLPYQPKVFALVLKRLEAWSRVEPECMINLSSHAQYSAYYSTTQIRQGGQIYIPDVLMAYMSPLEIRPVVDFFYDLTWHDVFVSKDAYDQLDLYSQAGLFIHEAWRFERNISAGCPMKDGTRFSPTDQQIQEWTAKIMFTDP